MWMTNVLPKAPRPLASARGAYSAAHDRVRCEALRKPIVARKGPPLTRGLAGPGRAGPGACIRSTLRLAASRWTRPRATTPS